MSFVTPREYYTPDIVEMVQKNAMKHLRAYEQEDHVDDTSQYVETDSTPDSHRARMKLKRG